MMTVDTETTSNQRERERTAGNKNEIFPPQSSLNKLCLQLWYHFLDVDMCLRHCVYHVTCMHQLH